MKQGDFVTVAAQCDLGKPSPALVIQFHQFSDHATLAGLPVTGTLVAAPLLRINIEPSIGNGLQKPSQIMVYKPFTLKRDKIGPVFGRINRAQMTEVERCLAIFVGIAK